MIPLFRKSIILTRAISIRNTVRQATVRLESTVNRFTERSHTCGELNRDSLGEKVTLFGWVQYTRFGNKIISLRDSYGSIQCVIGESQLTKEFRKSNIRNESVVEVEGVVNLRPTEQRNTEMQTGDIEVIVDKLTILSQAKADLPFLNRDELEPAAPEKRLKYRYLDLRRPDLQHALRFRSQVCKILRDKLYSLRFVECETPTLFNRTPGGANEYIVPTQIPDKFYSLTQSPQQLKQLLMIGGLDKYFQICRCYRDETGRSDRQPEFTQVDIEMSFTNQLLVMNLVEELIYDLMSNVFYEPEAFSSFGESSKLKRISYRDAFEKYGTDKPDMRFGWEIKSTEDDKLQIELPKHLDNHNLLDLIRIACEQLFVDHNQLNVVDTEQTFVIVSSDRSDGTRRALGRLRNIFAEELESQGEQVYNKAFDFIWVTDFPLFDKDEEGRLISNHHPFTAPSVDSMNLIDTDPNGVVGQHYDLVLNGQEIAGGSIRIHDVELQRKIFKLLNCTHNTFDYFLEAMSSGCPPHGGIAIGLDRLVAILMNRESIKDVIAFPKASSGRDLMTDCPQEITQDVKRMYHLSPS